MKKLKDLGHLLLIGELTTILVFISFNLIFGLGLALGPAVGMGMLAFPVNLIACLFCILFFNNLEKKVYRFLSSFTLSCILGLIGVVIYPLVVSVCLLTSLYFTFKINPEKVNNL